MITYFRIYELWADFVKEGESTLSLLIQPRKSLGAKVVVTVEIDKPIQLNLFKSGKSKSVELHELTKAVLIEFEG